jgi:hypothetical protein
VAVGWFTLVVMGCADDMRAANPEWRSGTATMLVEGTGDGIKAEGGWKEDAA